jgi:hypothetical protein
VTVRGIDGYAPIEPEQAQVGPGETKEVVFELEEEK